MAKNSFAKDLYAKVAAKHPEYSQKRVYSTVNNILKRTSKKAVANT